MIRNISVEEEVTRRDSIIKLRPGNSKLLKELEEYAKGGQCPHSDWYTDGLNDVVCLVCRRRASYTGSRPTW